MTHRSAVKMVFVFAAMLAASLPLTLSAAEPFNPISWLKETLGGGSKPTCDQCGQAHAPDVVCIERIPVEQCVMGKKKVFDCTTRYEYVTVPEVRYHWKNKWVTKEIPCPYCKPVCKTDESEHVHYTEKWDKEKAGCGELHCKTYEPKTEKVECKRCEHEKGETTIKVHYRTCVKEPYTVYRQVKRPVCVKQPRYEKVKVSITKHVCKRCRGHGCDHCDH